MIVILERAKIMEIQNILAKSIEAAELKKASLDASCKRLLANKIILAWILKGCVEEYKDYDIHEMEKNYIEGTPQIAEIAVHKDEIVKGNYELVEGRQTEDSSILEGTITYDIRFEAIAPVDKKKKILHDEFDIAMTKTMEDEVYNMCNYSKGVEEKGIQKGILVSVRNLIKNTNMTPQQAMAILEIPENEQQKYIEQLKQ